MTRTTSLSMTESNDCVPADSPIVDLRPYPVGEWHTLAQVSTLLVPKAARISFCTNQVSSLVHREEVIPPTESRPCCCWIRRNSPAAYVSASCHETSCQGSVIRLRIMGLVTRS